MRGLIKDPNGSSHSELLGILIGHGGRCQAADDGSMQYMDTSSVLGSQFILGTLLDYYQETKS
jgi:hypothetical protein